MTHYNPGIQQEPYRILESVELAAVKRDTTKRGRKQLLSAAIRVLRTRVERPFAWEDKFKRLLLRFERIQQRHYGMKSLAYTLSNLRAFCGT